MKNKKIFLTNEGLKKLKEELNYLKTEKREEVLQTLKDARALGDLSENSEYDAAKDDQSELESRINELEYTIENATIIKNGKKEAGIVNVGSVVKLQYEGDSEVEEYKIVGSQEADPFNNKISNESPVATAILNQKVGSVVEVTSPNGIYKVKILNIM